MDVDSPQALKNVERKLTSMGLSLPRVKSPSGMVHFWMRLAGVPEGIRYRPFKRQEVGDGQLIVNYNTAVPCSRVNGVEYTFVSGAPEDLPGLPVVQWRDMLWLVDPSPPVTGLTTPPIRLVRRPMPDHTRRLLAALQSAEQKQCVYRDADGDVGTYDTRSGAEHAVMCGLILAGWTFDEIHATFARWAPGHYLEMYSNARQRFKYLVRTYQHAIGWLANTPERETLTQWYHTAETTPWPGRTGASDRAVYLALLAVAWQWSTFEPSASQRCLAEHAGKMKRQTAGKALRRLADAGYIRLVESGAGTRDTASTWALTEKLVSVVPLGDHKSPFFLYGWIESTVWSPALLGRSAGVVYPHLSHDDGLTLTDLVEMTGKGRMTVWRALAKLADHGLAVSTTGRPARWLLGPNDLATVADGLGAGKVARGQREWHRQERRGHRARWDARESVTDRCDK